MNTNVILTLVFGLFALTTFTQPVEACCKSRRGFPCTTRARKALFGSSASAAAKSTALETPPLPKPTSIHEAAKMGNTAAVQAFLDAGVPVDERAQNGWTPLMYAVFGTLVFKPEFRRVVNIETIRLLLNKGADGNARYEAGTVLSLACNATHTECSMPSQIEIVHTLLNHIDPRTGERLINIDAMKGQALLNAASSCDLAVMQALIDAGAYVWARDTLGMEPLDYLLRNDKSPNFRRCLAILEEARKKNDPKNDPVDILMTAETIAEYAITKISDPELRKIAVERHEAAKAALAAFNKRFD